MLNLLSQPWFKAGVKLTLCQSLGQAYAWCQSRLAPHAVFQLFRDAVSPGYSTDPQESRCGKGRQGSRRLYEFFQTGHAPVDPAETVELFEFMTAAQLSKERGGAEVPLQELRK